MTKFPDDRAILQEVNCVVEALTLLVHTSLQKFENYNLDEGWLSIVNKPKMQQTCHILAYDMGVTRHKITFA